MDFPPSVLEKKKKTHGLKGNRNAMKRGNDTCLIVRCTSQEKDRWKKAAAGPLSPWVIEKLEAAASSTDPM